MNSYSIIGYVRSLLVFLFGATFSTALAVIAPSVHDDLRRWWNPPHIEACSPLQSSELRIFRESGELALSANYPVDNHFYFYFQNQTGRDMQSPRFFLNLSGYEGRNPHISKMAVMVSSFAAQGTSYVSHEAGIVEVSMDVLPRNATVLLELLAWEPVDVFAEIVVHGNVESFFQPANCEREVAQISIRNIEPVFVWSDETCEDRDWGMYCLAPSIDGVVNVHPGETLTQELTIVSGGEIFHPYDASVQFPSFPQLLSEVLRTGISVDALDLVERNEAGQVVVNAPSINLNVVSE